MDTLKIKGKPGRRLGMTDFTLVQCPVCGKMYLPAPQHAWRDYKGRYVCSYPCKRIRDLRKKEKKYKNTKRNADFDNTYKSIVSDGIEYLESDYFIQNYDLSFKDLQIARNNGLPYVKDGRFLYYHKQTFHDYWAGKIGGKQKKERENERI